MLKSDSLKRFSPMKSVYVCEYNFFTFYNLWFSDFVIFFFFQIKEEGMIGNFLTLFYRKDNFLIRLISKFSCFIQPYSRLLSYIFLSRKKHFTCSEHDPRCSLVHTFHADQQLLICMINAAYPYSILPGNLIFGEENNCYPICLLPGTLGTGVYIFSAHAPCFFNIAQNIWFYSILTLLTLACKNCLQFPYFLTSFSAFSSLRFCGFVVLFFAWFDLSSDIKRFSV